MIESFDPLLWYQHTNFFIVLNTDTSQAYHPGTAVPCLIHLPSWLVKKT